MVPLGPTGAASSTEDTPFDPMTMEKPDESQLSEFAAGLPRVGTAARSGPQAITGVSVVLHLWSPTSCNMTMASSAGGIQHRHQQHQGNQIARSPCCGRTAGEVKAVGGGVADEFPHASATGLPTKLLVRVSCLKVVSPPYSRYQAYLDPGTGLKGLTLRTPWVTSTM